MTSRTPYELLTRWNGRLEPNSTAFSTASAFREFARELLSVGMPLNAVEVTEEACQRWPEDLELMQMHGMALARSGAVDAAAAQLADVVHRLNALPNPNLYLLEESIGVLARTEKDLAIKSLSVAERQAHMLHALELYQQAYRATGGYWTGINVATLCTLLHKTEQAKAVAKNVVQQCQERLLSSSTPADPESHYWILATIGEALLNLQEWEKAENAYRRAAVVAGKRFGNLRSSQLHIGLLCDHFHQDPTWKKKWLPIPAVAIFTGHMVDAPDRSDPRFPLHMEPAVRDAIGRWLDANDVQIGVSSAACGGDILFQEALIERGSESHIILPFREELFLKTSVSHPQANWEDRFAKVVRNATTTIRAARDQTEEHAIAYSYTNKIIAGIARIRASELDTDLFGLAVWDGKPGAMGGTADAISAWQALSIPMSYVELPQVPTSKSEKLALSPVTTSTILKDAREPLATKGDTQLMSLLFADAAGFSQLSDREVRLFVAEYLARVAILVEAYAYDIAVRETAGDGLYLAFRTIESAGACALDLAEMVESTDWFALGFGTRLRLRVALHIGPVILAHDPITGLPKGVGAHVSRAARLEPKTPVGQVYASEAFAALAKLEPNLPFQCRYVKQLEWAKRYGTFPTYLVSRESK